MNITQNTIDATIEYIRRKHFYTHPDGKYGKQKRFFLSDKEHCDCCDYIRRPSAAYPYSLLKHACTAEHVANLFDADAADVKKLARGLEIQHRDDVITKVHEKVAEIKALAMLEAIKITHKPATARRRVAATV